MVSVRIVSESTGKPVKGAKVVLALTGRGVTQPQFTDSNGDAHFNVDPGTGKVIVKGSRKFEGRIAGRIVVYI